MSVFESVDDAYLNYRRRAGLSHHRQAPAAKRSILQDLLAKTDQDYAQGVVKFFQIDYDKVLKARRMGRASALEHLAYGVPEIAEVDARNYRITSCCQEEEETALVLELVFRMGYLSEYYTEANKESEIYPDGKGR